MDENKDATRYSITEFAKMLGVHRKTLLQWDKNGTLVAKRDPNGKKYYTPEQYDECVNRGMVKKNTGENKYPAIYTISQFAKMAGVSISTLEQLDNNGTFPAKRNHVGHRYYTDEDYAEYVSRITTKKKAERDKLCATNCFMRDTEFVTSDGIRRFRNFKDGEAVTVLAKDGRWREATVHKYGKQVMFDITFQSGRSQKTISCTLNHDWILSDGTHTTDLKTGDALINLPDIADELEPVTKNDIDMWCFGFVIGDGSDMKCKSFHGLQLELCGHKKEYLDKFLKAGYASGGTGSRDNLHLTKPTEMSKQSFLDAGAWRYMSTRGKQMLFMGYYAADGTRANNSTNTTDERLAKMILEISAVAGYHVSSYKIKEHIDAHCAEDAYYAKDATVHIIIFRRHQLRSNLWKVEQIKKHLNNRTYEAWCVEEPVTHSFTLAGGMVTGDCSPIGSEDSEGTQKESEDQS